MACLHVSEVKILFEIQGTKKTIGADTQLALASHA